MGQWANLFISPQRARGRAIIGIEAGNLRSTCGQLAYEEANKSGQSSAFACSALFVTCGQLAGNLRANPQDPQSGRAIIGRRESRQVDAQSSSIEHRALRSRPQTHKNHKSRSQVCQGHLCPCQIFSKTAKRPTQDPHKIHKDQKRAKWLVELVCRVSGTRDPQDPQDPHSHVVLHTHVVI